MVSQSVAQSDSPLFTKGRRCEIIDVCAYICCPYERPEQSVAQPGLYPGLILQLGQPVAQLDWHDGDNSPELSLLSSRAKLINRCLMVGPCMPVQRFLPCYSMGRLVVQRAIRLSIWAEVGHPCGTYTYRENLD